MKNEAWEIEREDTVRARLGTCPDPFRQPASQPDLRICTGITLQERITLPGYQRESRDEWTISLSTRARRFPSRWKIRGKMSHFSEKFFFLDKEIRRAIKRLLWGHLTARKVYYTECFRVKRPSLKYEFRISKEEWENRSRNVIYAR